MDGIAYDINNDSLAWMDKEKSSTLLSGSQDYSVKVNLVKEAAKKGQNFETQTSPHSQMMCRYKPKVRNLISPMTLYDEALDRVDDDLKAVVDTNKEIYNAVEYVQSKAGDNFKNKEF